MKRSLLPKYDLKELGPALGRMAAQELRGDPEILAEVSETKAQVREYLIGWLYENDELADVLLKWVLSHVSRDEFLKAAGLDKLQSEGEALARKLYPDAFEDE